MHSIQNRARLIIISKQHKNNLCLIISKHVTIKARCTDYEMCTTASSAPSVSYEHSAKELQKRDETRTHLRVTRSPLSPDFKQNYCEKINFSETPKYQFSYGLLHDAVSICTIQHRMV
jgi:hypothetical protein